MSKLSIQFLILQFCTPFFFLLLILLPFSFYFIHSPGTLTIWPRIYNTYHKVLHSGASTRWRRGATPRALSTPRARATTLTMHTRRSAAAAERARPAHRHNLALPSTDGTSGALHDAMA